MNIKFSLFLFSSLLAHILVLSHIHMPKQETTILSQQTPLSFIKKRSVSTEKTVKKVSPPKQHSVQNPKIVVQKKQPPKKQPIKPWKHPIAIKQVTPSPAIQHVVALAPQAVEVSKTPDNQTLSVAAKLTPVAIVEKEHSFDMAAYSDTIISNINHNISYPRVARKRGLEGDFEVRLDIGKTGTINTVSFAKENGSRILKRAILEGIENTKISAPGINVTLYLPVEFRLMD